jgi:hypothetical protein
VHYLLLTRIVVRTLNTVDVVYSMNNLKRLRSIFALTIISALSATSSARAGTSTGTFQGVSQIEVTPYVNYEPGTTTFYSWVPSVMNFTMTYNGPTNLYNENNNSFAYNISSNIQALGVSSVDPLAFFFSLSATDGIPGQSADSASGSFQAFQYHTYSYSTSFALFDPSGEFIGPNGNGNPSNVSMIADITYVFANYGGITESVFVEFQTIPEPSSIVMATSAALLILAWPILRARIGMAYTFTRDRGRQNQS